MNTQNLGSRIAIAAGVGTAVSVSSHNIAVGVGVGVAIFIAFSVFGNFKRINPMNQDQVQKRYYKEFFIAISAYVVILIGSISILKYITLPQPAQVLIAILPMIPIVLIIIAIMRGMRDSDELQQKIQSYAVMFSAVATGLITFSYGLLENVGFPPFPTIWVLPMMFMFWGLSLSYFWKKYQ